MLGGKPLESEEGVLLVIHGDQAAREILCRRLHEAGYAVIAARDAREALDAIESQDPDLVILDARAGAEQVLAGMESGKACGARPAAWYP